MTHGQWDPERRPQGQHAGDDRGQGRQCRHPGPAPRGPRRPVLERRPGEVSGFAEGRGRPGRDVSVLRTAWPPLAGSPLLPASRRVPLPSSAGASLPLLFSARSKGRTQASGTRRRSASSIPALFSFRGRPPKYPARWRQQQPRRPPGNALESLGRAGASRAAKPAAGGRAFQGRAGGEGRGGRTGQDPPARLCGFGRGGGGSSQARRETSGMWRRGADTHIFLLPGSRLAGTAGRGREPGPGDTARQRSRGWLGSGALPWSPDFPPPTGVLPTGQSSPQPLPRGLCPASSSSGSLHRMAREGQVLLWARWAAGHRGAG